MAYKPGAAASSREITSENARPIQSMEGSELRFSKRRMAIRSKPGLGLRREHESLARHAASAASLQYTRLQREQLLEFGCVAQGLEFGIFGQLVSFLETLF